MTCIIVDDEAHARASMAGILEENFPLVKVLAECSNIPDAVKAIHMYKPNVVFLDIEMPIQNGFTLFDYLNQSEINFKIIFVTAYSEYSLQAFEMSAVDYILKPAKVDSIGKALKKVDTQMAHYESYQALKENLVDHNEKKIVLQTAETIYVIKLNDIIFIQAEGNYTKFHTETLNVLTITKKIAEFDYLTNTHLFFRSHRSYMVNISKIKKIDKRSFIITLNNNEEAVLAQEKKQALLDKIDSL